MAAGEPAGAGGAEVIRSVSPQSFCEDDDPTGNDVILAKKSGTFEHGAVSLMY